MRRGILTGAAATAICVSATAQAQQATSAPLAPASKWEVSASEGGCLLSRSFGPGGAVSFAIRPLTGGTGTRLIVVTPDPAKRHRQGDATLTFDPTGATLAHAYESISDIGKSQRISTLRLSREELKPLDGAGTIAILMGDQPPLSLSVPGLDRARETLDQCETQLMWSWGIDPATIAKQPEPRTSPATWVTLQDYPSDALRSGADGEVGFRLRLGIDGLVKNCTVTQASVSKEMNGKLCALLIRRARFRPALGFDGKPVESIYASNFRFWTP